MNKQDWILSEQEQAEIFPPMPVGSKPALPSLFQPVFSDSDFSKPADFYSRSPIQRELFELDPKGDEERQKFFRHFNRPMADFFAVKLKQRLQKYGTVYAGQWFSEQQQNLRQRLSLVMAQYADVLSLLNLPYQDLSHIESLPFTKEYWQTPERESKDDFEQRKRAKIAESLQIFPSLAERLAKHKPIFAQSHLTPLWKMHNKQIKQLADTFALFLSEELDLAAKAINAESEEEAIAQMFEIWANLSLKVARFQLSLPQARTNGELLTALLKVTDPKTWERKFTKMAKRQKEHMAICIGMVHSSLGGYVSNERLKEFEQQKKANFEFIKNCIITNTLNEEEQHELLDIWLKTNANPKINRIELMTRLKGYEETADEHQHSGVFVTLTAPSKYHAMRKEGGENPKWNGASPAESQRYLCSVWARIRAALKREKIPVYGLRVAEPHHDATPHFHFVLWTEAEKMRELKRIIYHYALEEDGDEAGAKKRRCSFKAIDKEKGSATAYVAKYISKNIDALGMDGLFSDETNRPAKEAAARAKAWASLWAIRQFQFIGGATVGVYRELRRLGSTKQKDTTVDILRAVADVGCFASYLKHQGGIFALRKELKLKLHYIETEPNKYQETRQKVQGVQNNATGEVTKTRLKEWVIGKMPKFWREQKAEQKAKEQVQKEIQAIEKAGLPALGLVSVTVRSTENQQISQKLRESIKNELKIRKGHCTDYDVEDLISGKWIKIGSYPTETMYLRYSNYQLLEERVPKKQII